MGRCTFLPDLLLKLMKKCMSPVSLVLHTVVTVNIGLNTQSENIDSIILDVNVDCRSAQNFP